MTDTRNELNNTMCFTPTIYFVVCLKKTNVILHIKYWCFGDILLWVGKNFRVGSACMSKSFCESLGTVIEKVNKVWLHISQSLF